MAAPQFDQSHLESIPPELYNSNEVYFPNKDRTMNSSNTLNIRNHFIKHRFCVEIKRGGKATYEYNIQKCKLFDDTFPWATDEMNPVWRANKNKNNNNNQTRMENFVYQTTRTDDILDMFAEAKMPFSKMDLESVQKVCAGYGAKGLNRRSLRTLMFGRTEILMTKYFEKLSGQFVHVTIDAGTKCHRYLIIIVIPPLSSKLKPIVFDLRDELHLLQGYDERENDNDKYNDENAAAAVPFQHTAGNLAASIDQFCNSMYARNVCPISADVGEIYYTGIV